MNGREISTSDSTLCGLFCGGLILTLIGCSASNDPTSEITGPVGGPGAGGKGSTGPLGGGGKPIVLGEVGGMTTADGGTGGKDPAHQAVTTLPAGFKATDIGGFQLGGKVEGVVGMGMTGGGGSGGGPGGDCGNILLGVVRDFKGADEGGHADFETRRRAC